MKKHDDFMHDVDQAVGRKTVPGWHFVRRHFTVFSSAFLILLVVIAVSRLFFERPLAEATVIHEQIKSISDALNDIERDCNILTIRPTAAILDFFTVEKFTGSAIGCLNVAYPAHWKGPYFKQTPTIQGKPYEIVRAFEGYCVVPGAGVALPNGQIMGKDLVINERTHIGNLLKPGGALYYDGGALGVILKFKIGHWDSPFAEKKTADKVNSMWKEFNEALPYAQLNNPLENVQRC